MDKPKNFDESGEALKLGWFPLLVVLIAWASIIVLSCYAYRGPPPQPDDIVDELFSAERAKVYLQQLVGDSIPHPAGSQQNKIVRQRIVEMLKSFGYSVEIQSGSGEVNASVRDRSPDEEVLSLHNIIAVRKSKSSNQSKKKLMLLAHYDSVPTGPGASDDGVGTSALIEIARMFKQEPPPNRDIVFLITDGEEMGLLGAKLFVEEHPLADEIGIVINLEARGTTGPSCMFETSRLSRHLIPIYAKIDGRKFASSLFFEIYRRMPNDTDFSVLNKAGVLGYNFAFIGDVKNYHTTADNFENADLKSLQHHGDNAVGLVRELLKDDQAEEILSLPEKTRDEAVYFDLFGQWIVWWPSGWSIWFSGLAIAMFLVSCWKLTNHQLSDTEHQTTLSFKKSLVSLVSMLTTIVLVFIVFQFLQFAIRTDARLAHPWPANPVQMLTGYWLISCAVTAVVSLTLLKRVCGEAMWIAFAIVWLGLAVLCSIFVTGASHLFIGPILTATLFGIFAVGRNQDGLASTFVVAAIAVGVIWLPMECLFYDAVGFRMPYVMGGRMAIVSTALLSLLSMVNLKTRFWFAILCSVSSVGSFALAILQS